MQAQQSAVSGHAADSVLLSEQTDGNYRVCRYLVKNPGDVAYKVLYRINLATLNATFDGNRQELDLLDAFFGDLMNDTLMHVKSVTITGYSSPDGPLAFNRALAAKRAQDFKSYVDQKYGLSHKYSVAVHSVAEDWEMCRDLVEQMAVPDKQYVLNVIDGSGSPDQKEAALKKRVAAWNYMKANVLPPLRRVDMTIGYGEGTIVEIRTMMQTPTPVPEVAPQACDTCACMVVDDSITGIIVEIPESRQQMREMKKTGREVDQMIDHNAREAEKIAKKDLREARKIAKKEAKAAKKAEKMAKKTYKGLQKMEY